MSVHLFDLLSLSALAYSRYFWVVFLHLIEFISFMCNLDVYICVSYLSELNLGLFGSFGIYSFEVLGLNPLP